MKKLISYLGFIVVLIAITFSASCANNNNPAPAAAEVQVTALQSQLNLKDSEAEDYDYTPLFKITEDGEDVPVTASYIDSSAVKAEEGSYRVVCTYKEKSAYITVNVTATVYSVELDIPSAELTLYGYEVSSYDFKSHFKAFIDGEQTPVTDDMVTNGVKTEAGDYAYTVTLHGVSKTLTVHVLEGHKIEIVHTYASIQITLSEVATFDYTTLFSVYSDGVAYKVTADMIDSSAMSQTATGEYDVKIKVEIDGAIKEDVMKVTVVADEEVHITATDFVTYPNGGSVDLTTLFQIKKGDKTVPVTIDMISGTVDYSKEGDNIITLTYGNYTATAKVTVKLGVVINYAKGDTVTIKQGTDISSYSFADDFIIIINGLRFKDIPQSCFDLSEVDFGTPGTYTVTLTISYGDLPNSTGLGFPPLQQVTKEITYSVVSNDYEVTVVQQYVELDYDDSSFDPLSNVNIYINGVRRYLTTNPDYVNNFTYLAVIKTGIDYTQLTDQTVEIEVYVLGSEADPVTVTYTVHLAAEVTITPKNIALFGGATLYTTDLFTVTENGEQIPVTYDMLYGKVDTFTPGIYKVRAEYKGASAQATVIILDNEMKGFYRTLLTTIPVEEEDDDEYEEGWGGVDDYSAMNGGISAIAETGEVTRLGGMTIAEDGSITFDYKQVTEVTGLDANTLILKVGTSQEYTLYYDNGIIVVVPFNTQKLSFNDYSRPIIYFGTEKWNTIQKFTVNYSSYYVLGTETATYSIDAVLLEDKESGAEMWYALKVQLIKKENNNWYYDVTWGECTFSEGFENASVGSTAQLTYRGEVYPFTIEEGAVGKVIRTEKGAAYFNKTYTGKIDGKTATLNINALGLCTMTALDGTPLIDRVSLSSMPNGGDMGDGILLLYSSDENYFSYKLSVTGTTFEVLPRDKYYGKYIFENMYVFLDGYGTGTINFDKSSHNLTSLKYTAYAGEIKAEYVSVLSDFAYGTGIDFYVAPLLNILTVKNSGHPQIPAGTEFIIDKIIDGAIVRVSSLRFAVPATYPFSIKSDFVNELTVITSQGEMSSADKEKCVNTTLIDWSKAGFYKFTITVPAGGQDAVLPYTVEIIKPIYEGDRNLGLYSAVSYSGMSLTIDAYGRGTLVYNGTDYTGVAQITDDEFIIKAHSQKGSYACVKGKVIAAGVALVTVTGSEFPQVMCDHFTKANVSVKQAGGTVNGTGHIIRAFTTGGQTLYIHYNSTPTADFVTLEETELPDVYSVKQSQTLIGTFKIVWGDMLTGISSAA